MQTLRVKRERERERQKKRGEETVKSTKEGKKERWTEERKTWKDLRTFRERREEIDDQKCINRKLLKEEQKDRKTKGWQPEKIIANIKRGERYPERTL